MKKKPSIEMPVKRRGLDNGADWKRVSDPAGSMARRVAVLVVSQLRVMARRFIKRKDSGSIIPILLIAYVWGIIQFASAGKMMPPVSLKAPFLIAYSAIVGFIAVSRSASFAELAAFCGFHAVLKRELFFTDLSWKALCILAFSIMALPFGFLSDSTPIMGLALLGSFFLCFAAKLTASSGKAARTRRAVELPLRINIVRLVCGSMALPGAYAVIGMIIAALALFSASVRASLALKGEGFLGAAILADAFVVLCVTLDDTAVARSNVVRPFPRTWKWWLMTAYASEFIVLLLPRAFLCIALTAIGQDPVPFIAAAAGMSILSPCFFDPTIIQLVLSMICLVFAELFVMNGYYAMYSLIAAEAAFSVFIMRKYFIGVLYDGRSLERFDRLR
jgi:hypothetical protein